MNAGVEFRRENTERMDAINKLMLMDDTFMTQVFSSDLECTEELEDHFKRDDLTVTKLCYTVDDWKFVWTICQIGIYTLMIPKENSTIMRSNRIVVGSTRTCQIKQLII